MRDPSIVSRRIPRSAVVVMAVAVILGVAAPFVGAQSVYVQDDWSGGPAVTGPQVEWDNRFESSVGVAWRSIPGQIALSSLPIESPVRTIIVGDAGEPSSVAAGDVDGDGRDDVIVTDPVYDIGEHKGAIYWWRRDASGQWTQHTVDDDFYGAHYGVTADVDLDGDLDVVAAAYYGIADPPSPDGLPINGRFAWFENVSGDASSWQQHVVGELFNGASHVSLTDLDGDGDVDLLGASQLTDGIYEQDADIVWFENMDGAGASWAQHDVDEDFPNAGEAHAADLDGDGDTDIVGAHQPEIGLSHFHWWENKDGNALSWVKREIPFSFSGSGYLDVGDIDNDGDLDLIGGGLLSGQVGFWQNLDGSGTSWQAWFVTTLPGGRRIQLSDIDGDGDLDALVSTTAPPSFGGAWWIENVDGVGFSWQLHTLDFLIPSLEPWIAAGDVDHDGKLDALVCHWGGYDSVPTQQLAWWNLTAFDTSVADELIGSILDGGDSVDWGAMTWDADVPAGTSLIVQVRASDNPNDFGEFVTVAVPGTDLGALIDPRARYLQYRVELGTPYSTRSPVLSRIEVVAGSATPAGRVPGQSSIPGQPLILEKTGSSEITLSWDASCLSTDTDYAVYAGTLGAYETHEPLSCTTGGQTIATYAALGDDTYYIVVPRNSTREGSYGTDGTGSERSPAMGACLAQQIAACE